MQSRSAGAQRKGQTTAIIEEEKAWLRTNYGSECAFLRSFGLSIHKEEDREEGRHIMAYVHGIDD